MVNPDGKVGLKVRASTRRTSRERNESSARSRSLRASSLVVPRSPLPPPPRPPRAQISRKLIEKLDGDEAAAADARAAPTPAPSTSAPAEEAPAPSTPRASSPSPPAPQRAAPPLLPPFPLGGANLRDAAALAEYRPMFPGLDDALARSLRVGELLLKNEEAELVRAREYASEAQAGAYLMRRTDVPCVEEREACRTCYETNAADTLRCGAEVAAYDACARAARDAFIERGFAPQPLLEAGGEGEEGAGQDGPEGE